jgi:hypothetical protein
MAAICKKSRCELDRLHVYKHAILGEIRWRKTLYLFRTTLCSNWFVAILYLFVWSSDLACLRQCPHSGTNNQDYVRIIWLVSQRASKQIIGE